MENRVLRYFLVTAREENITKASEVVHISQPALSRQLMQLEEELGVKLFIRGKRSLTLTEEGRILRRRAQEIIDLTEKTEQELRNGLNALNGVISIGMGESNASGWIADRIKEFNRIYPDVRFEFQSGNADHIKDYIEKGLLDVGILIEPTELSKYEYLRLPVTDSWGMLVPSDSALAEKEFITPKDLLGRKVFVSKRPLASITKWLGEYYDEKNLFVTYNLIYNVATLVDKDMGAAFTLDGAVALYKNPNLKFIPLMPEFILTSVFVWKKYQTASPTVLKFIEFIKQSV